MGFATKTFSPVKFGNQDQILHGTAQMTSIWREIDPSMGQ
jgi:hypothetical protein